jgi:hypothetical protein
MKAVALILYAAILIGAAIGLDSRLLWLLTVRWRLRFSMCVAFG